MAGCDDFAKARQEKGPSMAGSDGFANPMASSATFANRLIHTYCDNGYYI